MVSPDRFVSILEFCRRSSLSRGTVYNMVARRELPQPTRLTANRVAFPAEVVDAWFAERMQTRTADAA
jgi:predicted DNA-binding transcriptional regulator AlpA